LTKGHHGNHYCNLFSTISADRSRVQHRIGRGCTALTYEPLHRQGLSGIERLFTGDGVLLRKHVRGDDLITFGAEKGDSLVSAILSVKYSTSALL
jgi:hypothetical protein